MTRTTDIRSASHALDQLSALGRDGVDRPTKAELELGLTALVARIVSDHVRRPRLAPWALAIAGIALIALTILRLTSRLPPARFTAVAALTYQIEGGSVLDGGYLREAGHGGVRLAFSEGSQFQLMPGSHGRLRAVDKEGARLAIENGTGSFQITPSVHRQWLVEVGPFVVEVKGTIFTVVWDPATERFELKLRQGRVVVRGPVSGGDLALRAGQRLVVDLRKAETLITEDLALDAQSAAPVQPPSSTDTAAGSAPAPALDKTVGSRQLPTAPSANSAKGEPERRWAEDLAGGQWDRILESVAHAGLDAAVNSSSSEELAALASAARYRRRFDVARAALLAQRRRFPDSPRALEATFFLGRVEESIGTGASRAVTWYDEYLVKAPAGAYAAEALGRKMTLVNQNGGPAQAQSIAEEYMRRFPNGSYSAAARAVLRVP
jgi:hypothetical protein